jgi:two-component sensor histidine kinase
MSMLANRLQLDGEFSIEQVPDVREFVERLHADLPDPDILARVSMAAHELFENAVKFAADGVASLELELSRERVVITTRNRARTDHLGGVRQMSAKLRAATDRMAFYVDLMRSSPKARGGLGLGRVAAEAEMDVAIDIVDDVVTVRAELGATA